MSPPWRACSRAARSRSISWVKNTAPCPMVRPISRSACSRTKLAVARCRSGGLKRLIWLPQGTSSEDDRQRKFIEALHAGRASSVRRGPDRRRHRGAESRDPRHLEEDRAAGTEATGIAAPAGEQPAAGEQREAASTSSVTRRTAKPAFPCASCASNWGLKSPSRPSRATPPRFARPTSKTWPVATSWSCFTALATRHGNARSTTN